MALFGLYKTRNEKANEEKLRVQRELESMLKRQGELGSDMYNALSDAARKNKIANVMCDGRTAEGIGCMEVYSMPGNGGVYSILAGIADIGSWVVWRPGVRGHNILQVNIDVKANKLDALFGAYGPSREDDLDSFETVKHRLAKYVREYTLYPRS